MTYPNPTVDLSLTQRPNNAAQEVYDRAEEYSRVQWRAGLSMNQAILLLIEAWTGMLQPAPRERR